MRAQRFLKLTALVVTAVMVTSCSSIRNLGDKARKSHAGVKSAKTVKSSKTEKTVETVETVETNTPLPTDTLKKDVFLQQVNDNAQTTRFITSKVKFSVEVGNRQMTLTGSLKMKRDDVIRLQLMAFGFVEAGRLEFTKDYVLIVDRINKQYLKVPYAQLEFFRHSGVDFYMLQSLFWNELFQPGE